MAATLPKGNCKYDGNCIRKNPDHYVEYLHPIQYPSGYVAPPRGGAAKASPAVGASFPVTPSAANASAPTQPPTPSFVVTAPTTVPAAANLDSLPAGSSSSAALSLSIAHIQSSSAAHLKEFETPTMPMSNNPFACFLNAGSSNVTSPKVEGSVKITHAPAAAPTVNPPAKEVVPVLIGHKRARSVTSLSSDATLVEDEEGCLHASPAPLTSAPAAPSSPRPTTKILSVEVSAAGALMTKAPQTVAAAHTVSPSKHAHPPSATPQPSPRKNADGAANANGGERQLPHLLQEILSEQPVLTTDYVSSLPPDVSDAVLADANRPIFTLADLYLAQMPEKSMRAVLKIAKEAISKHPPQPTAVAGPPSSDCGALCAFPGVRLVGPFEVLLRIMEREEIAGAEPLKRSDFPSDADLWSHWRFRQDPIEAITFLIPSALYDIHKASISLRQSVMVGQASGKLSVLELFHPQRATSMAPRRSLDLIVPPIGEGTSRLVSLSFHRDEWFSVPCARKDSAGAKAFEAEKEPPSLAGSFDKRYNPFPIRILQRTCTLSKQIAQQLASSSACNCVLPSLSAPVFRPIVAAAAPDTSVDVGSAISYAMELLKDPLMKALAAASPIAISARLPSSSPTIQPFQLLAGQMLQAASPPVTSKQIKTALKKREDTSFGKTFTELGVVVPYVKQTEMGYRDPYLSLTELKGITSRIGKFSAEGIFSHHGKGSSGGRFSLGGLTGKERESFDEEMRFLDIGNDECDFGLSLEVGSNMLYQCGGCTCAECTAAFATAAADQMFPLPSHMKLEKSVVNEVLWHAVRSLDTSYALLRRDMSRFVLRCYVRLLVQGGARFEVAFVTSGL